MEVSGPLHASLRGRWEDNIKLDLYVRGCGLD